MSHISFFFSAPLSETSEGGRALAELLGVREDECLPTSLDAIAISRRMSNTCGATLLLLLPSFGPDRLAIRHIRES